MPSHASLLSPFAALLLLLVFPHLAASAPSRPNLVYALQDQRPPVARINETWSWTLLPGTFNASSGSAISLSSRSLPSWATFDASTATFSGMPVAGDEGSAWVTVQANASGVARGRSDGFQLLVVDAPAPFVRLSIADQLPGASSFGEGATLTADGALKIPPTWSFSLGFQQYTFQDEYFDKIYYTAYQTGTTELPYWLNFDNETVTFDGVAPETPGEVSITIFGSEHFGYGDVEQTVKLHIGYHAFELLAPLSALNTTPSDDVSYTIPLNNLRIDNSTIDATNLTSIDVGLSNYSYLSYDALTRTISGTIPSDLSPVELPIPLTFTDQYNDTIVTNLTLMVFASLFTTSSIPVLNVVAGEPFSEDLSSYTTSNSANYSTTISPSAAQQWISFNATSLVLSGTAPSTLQNATLQLTATDPVSGTSSEASLVVAVVAAAITSTSPSASPTGGVLQPQPSSGLSRSTRLAIGLGLGLGLGFLLLALVFFCCRKRSDKDNRKMHRDGSTLIFNVATPDPSQTDTNTAGNKSALSSTVVGSATTKEGKFDSPNGEKAKGAAWSGPATELDSPPRRTIVQSGSAEAEAASAVAAAAAASSKPKRFDLMGLLKGGTPKKDMSVISLPIQPSQNSLYGLGIGNDTQSHDIVVVRDGQSRTFVPRGENDFEERVSEGESDLERSSSWETGGSSSLFYSEGSESEGRRTRRPKAPPSAPRQRRDFVPLPIRIPSPLPSSSSSPSPSRRGGIRLVASYSNSTDVSDLIGSTNSGSNSGLYDSTVFPRPTALNPISSNSIDSLAAPRLIPFTKERSPYHSELPSAHASQTALRHPHRNSAIEDADEGESSSSRPRSALYAPSNLPGSPATSAVIFTTPKEDQSGGWASPSGYSGYSGSGWASPGEGVRLVGSVASSPFIRDPPYTPRSATHQQHHQHNHRRTTSYVDPVRIAVRVNEPFRFTPTMNPAPFVSISSSPGRGGPPRATYHAFIDPPGDTSRDRQPLPEWIHFDGGALEIFGLPRRVDVGILPILVLERKAMRTPGSPTRRGSIGSARSRERRNEDEVEQVVARYEIEVGWRTDDSVEDAGEVMQIITY